MMEMSPLKKRPSQGSCVVYFRTVLCPETAVSPSAVSFSCSDDAMSSAAQASMQPPLCTLRVLLASAGSAQSLRGQIRVSPGSSLMALMLCLLLTQGQFQSPCGCGSDILASCLAGAVLSSWVSQCVLHASPSLSILLLTSESPCVCINPTGAV